MFCFGAMNQFPEFSFTCEPIGVLARRTINSLNLLLHLLIFSFKNCLKSDIYFFGYVDPLLICGYVDLRLCEPSAMWAFSYVACNRFERSYFLQNYPKINF